MIKKWLPALLLIVVGGIILCAVNWNFPQDALSVPVTLNTGEPALITGSLPVIAWLGDPVDLNLTFQFISPVQSGKAQIRAEIVMPDASITPNGQLSLTMNPSQPVDLGWQITPERTGNIEGTLWINSSIGSSEPQAVLAKRFQIHSISILGISATWVRRIGWGMMIIGVFYTVAFSSRRFRGESSPKN